VAGEPADLIVTHRLFHFNPCPGDAMTTADDIVIVIEETPTLVVTAAEQGPPGPSGVTTIAAADDVDTASLADGGVFVFDAKNRVFRATALVLNADNLAVLMADIPHLDIADAVTNESVNAQALVLNAKVNALAALLAPLMILAEQPPS
jgi:hypothetical protein